MLSSFEEVSRVFRDKGMSIGVNTIRSIAQRFASRSKIAQRLETVTLTDSLEQRRVVVSSDGGRLRIRKNKRGRRTEKGRRRYHTRSMGELAGTCLICITRVLKAITGLSAMVRRSC